MDVSMDHHSSSRASFITSLKYLTRAAQGEKRMRMHEHEIP